MLKDMSKGIYFGFTYWQPRRRYQVMANANWIFCLWPSRMVWINRPKYTKIWKKNNAFHSSNG